METVFITIHDLSVDARIKYVSDSVEDILGYYPHEIKGKSCWEYFHPDEMPFAKAIHGRGIQLDKAAVLNYCQIKHKDGSWVGCECVFTVVYDVLVACTSIYRRGRRSQQRALDAPDIRRIFSSSPRDPRYHMLSFISRKFSRQPQLAHEPRAALFINRFTRSSTIMFATAGVTEILGLSPEHLVGQSFYFCIAENCLKDAVRCVESAKSNDSIAYLRFWYRDPIQAAQNARDVSMQDSSSDDEEGGVAIASAVASPEPMTPQLTDPTRPSIGDSAVSHRPTFGSSEARQYRGEEDVAFAIPRPAPLVEGDNPDNSRSSSENSGNHMETAADAVFDRPMLDRSSSSSMTATDDLQPTETSIELEAVVSCSSDGLVVILRKARPFLPQNISTRASSRYANGVFASPWATEPVLPSEEGNMSMSMSMSSTATTPSETASSDFMNTIQEVAVFAWALTGINGTIADYGQGKPSGEALPPGGLPIWDPSSKADPENRYNGFMTGSHRPIPGMADLEKDDETTSSEDEILWKRAPQMPEFRRPKRRDHQDAFGSPEPEATNADEKTQQSRRRRLYSE